MKYSAVTLVLITILALSLTGCQGSESVAANNAGKELYEQERFD